VAPVRIVIQICLGLIFGVSFFVAILADNPLISVAGIGAMMLAGTGIAAVDR
jgi:hypothetical protein